MKNANDLNRILVNAIDRKIRQSAKDQLTCVRPSTGSSVFGEFCQQIDLTMNGKGDSARSCAATMLFNVIANVSEIADGRIPSNE